MRYDKISRIEECWAVEKVVVGLIGLKIGKNSRVCEVTATNRNTLDGFDAVIGKNNQVVHNRNKHGKCWFITLNLREHEFFDTRKEAVSALAKSLHDSIESCKNIISVYQKDLEKAEAKLKSLILKEGKLK